MGSTATEPSIEVSEAPAWLRLLGNISRSTPYFKGKWRITGALFERWFTRRRLWADIQLNPSTTITCNLWDLVQYSIWWDGENCEIHQSRYFKSLLKPGSVVFDVGSNVGLYSLMAAPLVGSEGRIYAFEPASRQFTLLTRNVSRNNFSQIIPFKLAVSDAPGEAVIHLDDEFNTGSSSLRTMGEKSILDETITCTTLDDFVETHPLDHLDVIKIDVEGYESAVIAGGQKTLEKFRPVLLIEVKDYLQRLAGFSRQELFDKLLAVNYHPFKINPNCRLTAMQQPEDGTLVAFRHSSHDRAASVTSAPSAA